MARRRASRGGKRGTKRPVGWVRSFTDEQVVDDSPTVTVNLMEGPDWAVGVMNEMATIRRVHLDFVVVPGVEIVQALFYYAVYVTDRDTVGINPGSISILDENLLAMGIFGHAARGAAGTNLRALDVYHLKEDIKAMRKVRDDQVLNLVMTTDVAATAVTVSGYGSVLMSRGQS